MVFGEQIAISCQICKSGSRKKIQNVLIYKGVLTLYSPLKCLCLYKAVNKNLHNSSNTLFCFSFCFTTVTDQEGKDTGHVIINDDMSIAYEKLRGILSAPIASLQAIKYKDNPPNNIT